MAATDAESRIHSVVCLIDDRVMDVLSLESFFSVFLTGQPGPALKPRGFWILKIPNVD